MLKSLLMAGTASMSVATSAFAAEQANDTTGDASPVGEIVVTAQKREQSLQDVPISLAVVQGAELRDKGIRDLEGLQSSIPNLFIQKTTAIPQIYIRGFGSAATNFGFDQSVSMYIDGIYHGRGRQFTAPLYDLERVEILRGPQGALLGKNTAAGAISIITANPTDSFEGGIDASYNFTRDGYGLFGYISGPLTDTLSFRAAGKYDDLGGYIRNLATGTDDPREKNLSGRISLRYEPGDGIDVTAKLQLDRLRTRGSNLVATSPAMPTPRYVVDSAPPFGVAIGDRQNGAEASLVANINLGDHTLTSITGYSRYDAHRTSPGGFVTPEPFLAIFDEAFDQLSQEIRIASPVGNRVEYIVGAYYDRSHYDMANGSQYNIRNALIGTVRTDFHQKANTISAFAQAVLNISDALRLQGSLRYTRNGKSADFSLVSIAGTPINRPIAIPRQTLKENNVDPSLTLQYDLASDIMLYATYARGSKGGGFVSQTRTVTPDTFAFAPERSTNYEAGIKSRFFDRRLTLNLTAYKTVFKNLQVSQFVPALNTFVTANAGGASSRGFEGYAEFAPSSAFRLFGSIAYTDAKYDDFPGAACTVGAPPGCTSATNNLAGFPLVGVSKWSGSAGIDYDQPITGALRLGFAADVEFRSRYFTATDYSPVYGRQEGYAKLNARIEIGRIDRKWSLALIGKNLTDKLTSNFSYFYPLPTPPVAVFALTEARTVAIQAKYAF